MNINGKHYRTIWIHPENSKIVQIIDQIKIPFEFEIIDLKSVDDVAKAIKDMYVRGAGLIGATAGYGMYLAAIESAEKGLDVIESSAKKLIATRPTAVNLKWAIDRQLEVFKNSSPGEEMIKTALETATLIADEDAENCRMIGVHGMEIIKKISEKKGGKPVNILTHCNAGWLAFVDYGSATSPVYQAHDSGIPVHVWVDETRPRNQGARLTAWELLGHGVPHTVIPDNAGGHLMQHGMVDMVIVGTDRTTYTGDVANKIGTYLKALAAHDNNIPFYVALPSSSIDWDTSDGVGQIPIEQRTGDEMRIMNGMVDGKVCDVTVIPGKNPIANYGFDVTPARLITGLITERGICEASEEGIRALYQEKFQEETL